MFGLFNRKNKKLLSHLEGLEFEEIIKHGNNLLQSGNAKDGIECYKFANSKLEDTDFNKSVALFSIANGYVFSGNFKEAKNYCQKALNSIPKSIENFAFNIEHPVKPQIEALINHIDSSQPVDRTKAITEKNKEATKEFTNISDELVWKLANRGILRMKLRGEPNPVYGYIKGRMRSMTDYNIQYEFTQLIGYNENDPMEEDEYGYDFRYVDLDKITAIKNLNPPSFEQLKFERFNVLMERIEESFYGNFHFDISPQGNVLFLNSDYIDSPVTAINTINIMLQDKNDWEAFNAMNFDLVVFRGEQTFKLTNEQVYGVFIRR